MSQAVDGIGRRGWLIERLSPRRLLVSFAALHTVNVALSTGYSIIQLLIFARVLGVDRYAEMVFLTTIGLFVLPLSVAAGRANYSALREGTVRRLGIGNWPQVLVLLASQFGLLNLLSLLPLLIFRGHDAGAVIEDLLYLNFCLAGNFWLNDVQPTAWAIELDARFIYVLIGRTLATYLALALLWWTRRFLDFAVATALIDIAMPFAFFWFFRRHSDLPLLPPAGSLHAAGLLAHARRLWAALIASLTEMVTLNLPYALLTVVFGIGPALIAYDVIMKMVRVVTAFARMLTEIALPRISRQLHLGEGQTAWRAYLIVLGLCALGAAALGLLLVCFGRMIFALLLGPSDVVPDGARLVAAVVVLISAFFQPALYMISVNNGRGLVLPVTAVAASGFAAFAALSLAHLPLLATLWAYAGYFALVTATALWFSRQAILRGAGRNAAALDAGTPA